MRWLSAALPSSSVCLFRCAFDHYRCQNANYASVGLFSYFLATTASHSVHGPNWVRAVEGISGAAVLYTIVAILLTCCLGGKPFFAFIGICKFIP
jgi:hypothetical protein